MKKYKIEFRGWGCIYKPVYANTIPSAVKAATKEGWRECNQPNSNWDMRPTSAMILERVGGGWELVATVSGEGLRAEDSRSRESYKIAEWKLLEAQAIMERADDVVSAINEIAEKSFRPNAPEGVHHA